jgi:hypothetical protein
VNEEIRTVDEDFFMFLLGSADSDDGLTANFFIWLEEEGFRGREVIVFEVDAASLTGVDSELCRLGLRNAESGPLYAKSSVRVNTGENED